MRRQIAGALAGAFLAFTVGLFVPAHADSNLGGLTLQAKSGSILDTLTMTTSAPCPASADSSKATIIGPGFAKRGQNLTGVAPGFTSKTHPFKVESEYTLRDTAALAYPPVVYKGAYRIEVTCINTRNGIEPLGSFSTVINFATPVQWSQQADTVPVKPGPTMTLPAPTEPAANSATPTASKSASANSAAASPSPTASGTASQTAGATAAPTTSSASSPNGAQATSSAVAAESSTTPSSVGSWLPALAGVLLGGAAVGGGMFAYQRRSASGGGNRA